MSRLQFIWCRHLVVRTDIGNHNHPDHKTISCMECDAPRCKYRGRCVRAIFDGAPIRNSSQITNEIAYELEQKES